MQEKIIAYLKKSASLKQSIAESSSDVILEMIETLVLLYQNSGRLLVMGNGGSASDAQHFVAELVGRFLIERRALDAMALTGNSSVVTAVSNDYGFDHLFSRQIEAYCRKGDVVLGISTSGSSPNILHAMTLAKKKGATLLALIGQKTSVLSEISDHCLSVPSLETSLIQECHISVLHLLCQLLEEKMFV